MLPFSHLFAQDCPRNDMEWEYDEHLEGMKAFEWCLERVPRRDKSGQLNKAATLPLALVDA
jgi:hypothetical protein